MKFVAISDTHGMHNRLILPKGDAIIHAGDISRMGHEEEVIEFLNWFKELDFRHKIFIPGNHDFFFESSSPQKVYDIIPENVIYLNDSAVTIDGIKIWGSPISPWFHDWAFNRKRGFEINMHWNRIPPDTDILITHGPAYGRLDKTIYGDYVGCEDLLNKIHDIKPKYHICGHIHEAYGKWNDGNTTFINASVLDHKYRMKNEAILFEL
ncbi:MAG: metallophosphatase domain-containing protein [Bacteroidia bacterium]|nr:metallophosphatase domain-containing protein [Bacteroidia bacterium]